VAFSLPVQYVKSSFVVKVVWKWARIWGNILLEIQMQRKQTWRKSGQQMNALNMGGELILALSKI